MKRAPRKRAPSPTALLPAADTDAVLPADIQPEADRAATPIGFDAIDERFIDFLVEEALKTWRARIS